jgi:DNA-binding NarL/FixJ family response regulator
VVQTEGSRLSKVSLYRASVNGATVVGTMGSARPIRLVIVEDHPALAEGLAALVRGESDVELIGVAGDGDSAADMITNNRPDVVLCDVVLDGERSGLRLLKELAGKPAPAFIMFSAYGYPDYYVTALEQGAAGYLLKMATIGEVMGAVRTVASGGRAFPSDILRGARRARRRPTPRQREIIALVADGKTNEEIASALSIHVKTVEGQLRRVFDRYDVANRTELARVAEREGWISGP